MQLQQQLSNARKERGLTQEELAEKANLTVRTIQRIETGDTVPRVYTIKAIAKALDLPFESLQVHNKEVTGSTGTDTADTSHFLQLLVLSCFSYLLVPFVHFLLPLFLLRRHRDLPMAAILFGRRLVNSQIYWQVGMILLFFMTLAWNLMVGKNNPSARISYLSPFFISYFINAVVIGVFWNKTRRWQLS